MKIQTGNINPPESTKQNTHLSPQLSQAKTNKLATTFTETENNSDAQIESNHNNSVENVQCLWRVCTPVSTQFLQKFTEANFQTQQTSQPEPQNGRLT